MTDPTNLTQLRALVEQPCDCPWHAMLDSSVGERCQALMEHAETSLLALIDLAEAAHAVDDFLAEDERINGTFPPNTELTTLRQALARFTWNE